MIGKVAFSVCSAVLSNCFLCNHTSLYVNDSHDNDDDELADVSLPPHDRSLMGLYGCAMRFYR